MTSSPEDRPAADDPKRQRILEGATKVFLAYGFGRTTMDDIARAAELSRPALYLVFRNKTDIYRALAAEYLRRSREAAETALAGEGPLLERLDRMVDCAMMEVMAEIETSPHGSELFDMKNSLAGDMVAAWRASMLDLLEAAIADEAGSNGVDLAARGFDARSLGAVLLDALDGMKAQVGNRPQELREAALRLVRVITAALRP